jgi:hypothetical protein
MDSEPFVERDHFQMAILYFLVRKCLTRNGQTLDRNLL